MKKEQLIVEALVKRFLVEYLKNNFKIVGSKDDSSKYDKDIWMNPATVKKILKERNK